MRTRMALVAFLLLTLSASAQSILITNADIYDGSGKSPKKGAVRVEGDAIVAVGKLAPKDGEQVIDARGMALAPGFIDMHSHADREIFTKPPDAAIRQGITTVLVGQDGGSIFPLKKFFADLEKTPPAMNVASMAGHSTVRQQVMGKDLYRAASKEEIERMHNVLHYEMAEGAMGMSTGLEYESAHFATTDEVVELSRMVKGHGGFYNSHVRDEGPYVFKSYEEITDIGKQAKLPVVITHAKLAAPQVWNQAAKKMPGVFANAKAQGSDLWADVYPYTYWQSTLRVLVTDRDWFNLEKVKRGLYNNGTPPKLRITRYEPDPSVEGKTLAEIATLWKMTPEEAYMKMIRETSETPENPDGKDEGVIGESMTEQDIKWFIAHPRVMFCTDGQLDGKHPRGAGAFPRILGRYVREQNVLPLHEAIRKMTSLPAQMLGLTDRGKIAAGMKADLVLFDPKTVIDRSTIEEPLAAPEGIDSVMVNGKWVVREGKVQSERPGRVLRRPQPPQK